MNVLDLFSGIGGFSLGLERAGMRTVAFCEVDEHCQRVLARHWPNVPCYDDVRTLTAKRLADDGIAIDVICGGFPCQDISVAGKGAGLSGERSGLWGEYARLIGELRPRFVIVENVAALRGRGLAEVLGTLATLGFDAEWHCIPASAVGAPHQRDRIWIIAYPNANGGQQSSGRSQSIRLGSEYERAGSATRIDSDTSARGRGSRRTRGFDPSIAGKQQSTFQGESAHATRLLWPSFFREQSDRALRSYWPQSWSDYLESIRSLDDGIPDEVGELAGYGNAVVPVIPEIIGRAIMRIHNG
jgi:DNA (cytosine-5)-methyltransferase 1